ncbi:MAG: hypothetical protein GJ680_19665 [Alteromonadaceae bacterium]|nr:hypothetical protein [Alteromonadaceae bacterium]
MNRQTLLLTFLAVIASVRFIVMPAFEFLDEEYETLRTAKTKNTKEKLILESSDVIRSQVAQIDKAISKLDVFSFESESIELGKLQVQKILEDEAIKRSVKIKRLSWSENEDGTSHTIQLFVEAIPPDWVIYQSEIEAQTWLTLEKMTFRFPRSSGQHQLIGKIAGLLAYKVTFKVDSHEG